MGLFDNFFGLFDDEKRVTVGTTVSRVIQDDGLPNAIKTGVLKSIFDSGNIPEYAMEEMLGSIGIRADRMYEYARTHYTYGLPTGQFKSATAGLPEATAILTALEGVPVTPIYCHYGPPNTLHIAWLKLIADHGYNPITNQLAGLTTSMGLPIYLDNIEVVVPELQFSTYSANALAQWGISATAGYTPLRAAQGALGDMRAHTPVRLDAAAVDVYIRVTYIWSDPLFPQDPSAVLTDTFNISVSEYDAGLDYFHAKYKVGSITKYWMYQDSSGTYPTLDDVFSTAPSDHGTFFPFTYFRYDRTAQNVDTTSESYRTSKKLVSYLGMDYATVASAVDSNPGISDVEQAMLVMAVPATTSNELERRYLFSFFENLYHAGDMQFISLEAANIASALAGDVKSTHNSLIIQDTRFTMTLSNAGIYKRRKRGSVAPIGQYFSTVGTYAGPPLTVHDTEGVTSTIPQQLKYHTYCKQITANLYDEIHVLNPSMQYHIYAGRFTTSDDNGAILLIPLDRSITGLYSLQDREQLYARSLHYVFNSRVVTTIAWYQQPLFGGIMTIVSFVMICLSFGSSTGPVGQLMSAIAAGSSVAITAAVLALLQYLFISMLIAYAFKIFAKEVGVEVAIILAVIAAAVSMSDSMRPEGVPGAPWAARLMQASTGLSNGASAALKDMYGELLEQYQSFNLLKDESTKAIEAANKLLEHNNWLSPFVIFGEKPDDYYNRTVHAGNVGVSGIGAISYYVDNALTLPKLDETLEG